MEFCDECGLALADDGVCYGCEWYAGFGKEALIFPPGRHDDHVDAVIYIWRMLPKEVPDRWWWLAVWLDGLVTRLAQMWR